MEEGKTTEQVLGELNGELKVKEWRNPFQERREMAPEDAGAPWWWDGAEDASQSFLRAQGVTL